MGKDREETQLAFIKRRLEESGRISRNECLRNYISRLGARIADLKAAGMEFETVREGGDYVYKLKTKPVQLAML